MSERYTRVFSLKENLYSKNSPVIICAGALLKDNAEDTVLAQLKIKNISDRAIKAVRVAVTTYDVADALLDEGVQYEYLDLAVTRDVEFGQKNPIKLNNNSARSFVVCINEVIFSDGSIWKYGGEEWESIPTPKKIQDVFNDSQLVKQYKLEYGQGACYEATADRDLWICTCGHINHINEKNCPICRNNSELLSGIDTDALNSKKEQRLLKEKEEADIQKKKAQKNKSIAIAVALAAFVIIGSIAAVISYGTKSTTYDEAVVLFEEHKNKEAMELFASLGSYKDSDTKLKEATYRYTLESMILGTITMEEAGELFKSLKEYNDSESYAVYAAAITILQAPSTYQQYDNYIYLRDYREDMKSKFDAAKATIEAFDGEKNQALNILYNNINTAIEYYGKWKVVSGNKKIALEYKNINNFNEVSFVIDYSDRNVVLYLVPHNVTSDRVWGGGLYTTITNDVDEPFECENSDKNICKISKIKDGKVVIKEYKKGKVIDKLTLKKIS